MTERICFYKWPGSSGWGSLCKEDVPVWHFLQLWQRQSWLWWWWWWLGQRLTRWHGQELAGALIGDRRQQCTRGNSHASSSGSRWWWWWWWWWCWQWWSWPAQKRGNKWAQLDSRQVRQLRQSRVGHGHDMMKRMRLVMMRMVDIVIMVILMVSQLIITPTKEIGYHPGSLPFCF